MTLTSPSNAQGYAVRRHDDAVLRGAVGAEDDGARVVIHIQLVPPPLFVDEIRAGYIPLVPQMLLRLALIMLFVILPKG